MTRPVGPDDAAGAGGEALPAARRGGCAGSTMMRALVAAVTAAAALTRPGTLPTPSDFEGRWRVESWIGEDGGGAQADWRKMIGKEALWSSTSVRLPTESCRLTTPRVVLAPNQELEDGWGRETISDLRLSATLKQAAFGATLTPVFKAGPGSCVDGAVLAGRRNLILMLENGHIYLFRKVLEKARQDGR